MYWLNNARKGDVKDPATLPPVIDFINKYITTDSSIPNLENLISY